MKRNFLPYYLSRAALSAAFAILVFGLTWKAALFAVVVFGLFLLYLHSGWFRIDPSQPLTPLRRDDRGRDIQRKALIAGVIAGILIYITLTQVSEFIGLSLVAGPLALSLAVLTYFATQFALFGRG
jgi:ABC-type microcin C transport system permease subunit YejE